MSTTASISISARAQNCAQGAEGERERTFGRNRDHIFLRNDFHHVEDEAVVLENDEVNVLASDQFGRAADGGISQNGRALFREFDEQNFAWLARDRQTRLDDFSHESQKSAERNSRSNDRCAAKLRCRQGDSCEEKGYSLRLLSAPALFRGAARVVHPIDHALGGPRDRVITLRQQASKNRKIAHRIVRVLRRNLDIDDIGRRMLRKIFFECVPSAGHDPRAGIDVEMLCALHPKT